MPDSGSVMPSILLGVVIMGPARAFSVSNQRFDQRKCLSIEETESSQDQLPMVAEIGDEIRFLWVSVSSSGQLAAIANFHVRCFPATVVFPASHQMDSARSARGQDMPIPKIDP